ncbi:hypothetical protein Tco_1345599 [Tanacetum coccineum]
MELPLMRIATKTVKTPPPRNQRSSKPISKTKLRNRLVKAAMEAVIEALMEACDVVVLYDYFKAYQVQVFVEEPLKKIDIRKARAAKELVLFGVHPLSLDVYCVRIGDQILVQHALESAMKGEYSRE